MAVNLEQLAASNQATVESLLALANTALATAERVAALNLEAARGVLDQGVAGAKAVFSAKDPQQALAAQSALVQPAVEQALAYSKSIMEISSESQQQVANAIESTFSGYQKHVANLVEQASKAAPAGSEQIFAGIKAAMDQANGAFANLAAMSKQLTDTSRSNLFAAASNFAKAAKK
jgi:phasin family protein